MSCCGFPSAGGGGGGYFPLDPERVVVTDVNGFPAVGPYWDISTGSFPFDFVCHRILAVDTNNSVFYSAVNFQGNPWSWGTLADGRFSLAPFAEIGHSEGMTVESVAGVYYELNVTIQADDDSGLERTRYRMADSSNTYGAEFLFEYDGATPFASLTSDGDLQLVCGFLGPVGDYFVRIVSASGNSQTRQLRNELYSFRQQLLATADLPPDPAIGYGVFSFEKDGANTYAHFKVNDGGVVKTGRVALT